MNNPTPIVYAFIDAQNVYQGVIAQGWRYDLRKLRVYLSDKFNVTHALFFIGQMNGRESFYTAIQSAGFIIQFRETSRGSDGKTKGNVDVNLTLMAVDTIDKYDKAILLSADGDFAPLVRYWVNKDKFGAVISPATKGRTSRFLKRDAKGNISYLSDSRAKLER